MKLLPILKFVVFTSLSISAHCGFLLVSTVNRWPCDRCVVLRVIRWPCACRRVSRVIRFPARLPATELSAFWIRNLHARTLRCLSVAYNIKYGSLPNPKFTNGFLFAGWREPPRCMVSRNPWFVLEFVIHLLVHLLSDSTCHPWLNAGTLYFLIILLVWISLNLNTYGLNIFRSFGSGGFMKRWTSSRSAAWISSLLLRSKRIFILDLDTFFTSRKRNMLMAFCNSLHDNGFLQFLTQLYTKLRPVSDVVFSCAVPNVNEPIWHIHVEGEKCKKSHASGTFPGLLPRTPCLI